MGLNYNQSNWEWTIVPEIDIRLYMLMQAEGFALQIKNLTHNWDIDVKGMNNSSLQARGNW